MIVPRYRIAASTIPGAGQGLFIDEPVTRGRILVAPDAIPRTWTWEDIAARPDAEVLLPSTIRWFENRYTVSPEWPDECFVNHAFQPNGIWHLGFVFAATDLASGTELTVDYRHLLGEGQREAFNDALTGAPIVGLSWADSLALSTRQVAALLGPR
ncbi:MAG: hypothetical protein ACK59M_17980 [Pseudomonadota bacterium]|jgi:hypothetical protein